MTVMLKPIALGAQLAGLLRKDIIRGQVEAGTHLVEDALATKYAVSRGPVRDAFKTLLAEGLLESRRRGFYVRPFTQDDITELYQIRGAAELLAGHLAIERSVDGDWDRAREHLSVMETAADVRDAAAYARADLAFHTEFYRNSRNTRLRALWQQYEPTFATMLDITNAQDPDLHPSFDDHVKLLAATLVGDRESFTSLLQAHLEGSRQRMAGVVPGPG